MCNGIENVKNLDPRVGLTADTGHWIRSGINPLESLKKAEGRLISVHLKDLKEYDRNTHDVPYGTGVANVGLLLDELKRQGFNGNIAIEYEYNWENNLPDIKQCIDFVREYGVVNPWKILEKCTYRHPLNYQGVFYMGFSPFNPIKRLFFLFHFRKTSFLQLFWKITIYTKFSGLNLFNFFLIGIPQKCQGKIDNGKKY